MQQPEKIAIVGMGALLPDAADVAAFWQNILQARYSIGELPAGRWDTSLYYDPDPSAIDKTYAKIGAFVKGFQLDPIKLGLTLPPRLQATLDLGQQWALYTAHQTIADYGVTGKALDNERTAVIIGNSNAGEAHYRSTFRILLPEYQQMLRNAPEFKSLPAEVQQAILDQVQQQMFAQIPVITEDTMPGELGNIIPGRIANLFNLAGANFTTDAACASSLASVNAACLGLLNHQFDAVLTGGVDRSMGVESYIKFSKIGALSPDGSRPYADGANGFVMGEGAVLFLLKRLSDAEAAGDRIYAVINGVGASSDGKGKGITAPNPVGQQRAIERAWQAAGISPANVGLIEGHGTSTRVGDVAEVSSLRAVLDPLGMRAGSVGLGSVKSNIGHLKSAAGAAGMLKAVLALHHRLLPPTTNYVKPNPAIDLNGSALRVLTQAEDWGAPADGPRLAGVSSFGFGGTNFHIVLEEYLPGRTGQAEAKSYASAVPVQSVVSQTVQSIPQPAATFTPAAPASDDVQAYVLSAIAEKTGYPAEMLDVNLDLEADLGVDTVKQAELFAMVREHYNIPRQDDLRLSEYNTIQKVIDFIAARRGAAPMPVGSVVTAPTAQPAEVKKVEPQTSDSAVTPYQGLFFASAETTTALQQRVAGQLEQIKAGMVYPSRIPAVTDLRQAERIAIDYADNDELIKRLEKALSGFDTDTSAAWKALQAHGIYRGSGETGKVAFLFPGQGSQYVNMLQDIYDSEPLVKETFDEADAAMEPLLGRPLTSFIYTSGSEEELKQAEQELKNTAITQPAMLTANVAILRVLAKFGVTPDFAIGHSLGEYAALVAAGVLGFADALQIVSARGQAMTVLEAPDKGCMAAVSAPLARVKEIIAAIDDYVVIANINSPVQCVLGGSTSGIDLALERFKEVGFQAVKIPVSHAFHTKIVSPASGPLRAEIETHQINPPQVEVIANVTGETYPTTRDEIINMLATQVASPVQFVKSMETLYNAGARVFIESGPKRVLSSIAADNLKQHPDVIIIPTNHPRKGSRASFNEALCAIYAAGVKGAHGAVEAHAVEIAVPTAKPVSEPAAPALVPAEVHALQSGSVYQPLTGSVVFSGAGIGLPGKGHPVFSDDNVSRILNGEMMIEMLDPSVREEILAKRVTRLQKNASGAVMEEITDVDQVIKVAGQAGSFDLVEDFGVPTERNQTLDQSTRLALAAGIEALHDAGIPLMMNYRETTTGSRLPDRWKLPEALQDETGVIFGSAFPGLNELLKEDERFYQSKVLDAQLAEIENSLKLIEGIGGAQAEQLVDQLKARRGALQEQRETADYHFDRHYVFRILSMGHSQFAEYIGARGPNTHVNAACATTTHAVSIAEDWIRSGRCRRVIVISGDDVTNPLTLSWIGTGLFASGAATTEGNLRMAAMPFDRRRNGMIIGMGGAALVLESEDALRERGMTGIAELLATYTANSAFHGTRLDVRHVSAAMNHVLATAERRYGIDRNAIAGQTMFMSHETYTPARGGSASAEINALRHVFGAKADQVIIANTKGFTGHSMGVGLEDVVAIKALETGLVPPIAHIDNGFEPDPELGNLNLSRGGKYDPQFALRLGAGFGSQIALSLARRLNSVASRVDQAHYQEWLRRVSGYDNPQLERVKRTLRVKDQGAPRRKPGGSTWSYGEMPRQWAGKQAPASAATAPAITQSAVEAPSAPVQPVSPPVVSVPATEADSDMQAYILHAVSDKTGYPVEVLDLDLDLEADLGVDTVKQAELFAGIREHFDIPRREDLILAEYNTLRKVLSFMQENRAGAMAPEVAAPSRVQASAPVAPQPAASTMADPAGSDDEEIKNTILAMVSEKTGYPVEMLDMELDLEADLGIDTVKQAELFASIRTHYNIPRQDDLVLAEYNTLSKVLGFIRAGIAKAEQPAAAAPEAPVKAEEELTIEIRVQQPVPVLLPQNEAYLPAEQLLKDRHLLVVKDKGKNYFALVKKLEQAGAVVTALNPGELAEKLPGIQETKKLDGAYFMPALDNEADMFDKSRAKWDKQIAGLTEALYKLGRQLPASAFIIAATRMGGLLGLDKSANPYGGMVSGFLKSLRLEHRGQRIKIVDFEQKTLISYLTDKLIAETLRDPVNLEIGYYNGYRFGVALRPVELTQPLPEPSAGQVYLISGGTAGTVAPVVRSLAGTHKGSQFILLGRTKLLEREDSLLAAYLRDKDECRRMLMADMQQHGEKVTPVAVDARLEKLEKAAGMHALLADVARLGNQAHYFTCDIADPASCRTAVAEVLKLTKKVDVFIHAAGIDKSRKLENKTLEEVQDVVAPKTAGLVNMLSALDAQKLLPGTTVMFSSVAGRFGNLGQTDYAAANDYLSKMADWLPGRMPGMRVISIDWGAWAEVGMASRGSIPRIMAMAGIEMMPPHQAADMVGRLLATDLKGELIVSGALGKLTSACDGDCGLNIPLADQLLRQQDAAYQMSSHLTRFTTQDGIVLEDVIDPGKDTYLLDHAINGIPVLPGVVGVEGFASAAKHIASSLSDEKRKFGVLKLENIHFLTPIKFYRNQPRKMLWKAVVYHTPDGMLVRARLESDMQRANGQLEHFVHFTGDVYLVEGLRDAEEIVRKPRWRKKNNVEKAQIYKLYFHGPAFQVLEGAQSAKGSLTGKFSTELQGSVQSESTTEPMLVELCFQTAGLFQAGATGEMGLPSSIGSLKLYGHPDRSTDIFAEVKPHWHDDKLHFDMQVKDARGRLLLEMEDYQTIALPYLPGKELVEPMEALVPDEEKAG